MSGNGAIEDLFEDGGPFEDPLAQQAARSGSPCTGSHRGVVAPERPIER